MYRCVIVALLLACSLALDLDAEWSEFKRYYRKSYGAMEEPVRRATWEANLDLIEKHNLQADRGQHSYWLGMNKFGDMTAKEVIQMMNGLNLTLTSKTKGQTFLPPSNVDIPTSVDWRTKGYVTPVKNQGQCGSCWAFSATGSLEGQHFRKTGQLVSVSEQNLVDCSTPQGNSGCDGGLMDKAFRYVIQNGGIDTEASYPYEAMDGPCRFTKANIGATCTGYVDITKGSEVALQTAVATGSEISKKEPEVRQAIKRAEDLVSTNSGAATGAGAGQKDEVAQQIQKLKYNTADLKLRFDTVHQNWYTKNDARIQRNILLTFHLYKSGVYYDPSCSSTKLDHGVLVVGYGVDAGTGQRYWIVKNSWGADWGNAGYIWMAKDRNNACGIASLASYPTV